MNETLLIVDDDIDTLKIVGLILERQGYSILTVNDGYQAIETAIERQPDLILMDISMPRMDGYEATRKLREDSSTADIPIIMLTAKSDLNDKVTGFEAGADDYLTKPAQPRELIAHIRAVLARSLRTKPQPAAKSTPERGRVIGVLAAKGGVGVTAFALQLGLALNRQTHEEVVVAEYRPGQGSLGLYLGYDRHDPNLLSIMEIPPGEICQRHVEECIISYEEQNHGEPTLLEETGKANIKLLLSSFQPRHAHFIGQTEFFSVVTRILTHMAGHVIIDLGPSIPPITEKVMAQCDEVIVLVSSLLFTVVQTGELLADLAGMGIDREKISVVLIDDPINLAEVPFSNTSLERVASHVLDEGGVVGTTTVMSPYEIEDYLQFTVISETGASKRPIHKLVNKYLEAKSIKRYHGSESVR